MSKDLFEQHYTKKALEMIERAAFIKKYINEYTKNDDYKNNYYYYEESFTISYIIALLTTENELKKFLEVDGYNLDTIGKYFEIENFEENITKELKKQDFLNNKTNYFEKDKYQMSPILIRIITELDDDKIDYDKILLGVYYAINLLSFGQEMYILKKENPKTFDESYTYKKITGEFKDNPMAEKYIELYAASHEQPTIQLPHKRKQHSQDILQKKL